MSPSLECISCHSFEDTKRQQAAWLTPQLPDLPALLLFLQLCSDNKAALEGAQDLTHADIDVIVLRIPISPDSSDTEYSCLLRTGGKTRQRGRAEVVLTGNQRTEITAFMVRFNVDLLLYWTGQANANWWRLEHSSCPLAYYCSPPMIPVILSAFK